MKLGRSDGLCENGNEPFGLHKLRESSWVVEERLDFKEGLCSLDLSLRNIQTVDCSADSEGSEWNVGRDVR